MFEICVVKERGKIVAQLIIMYLLCKGLFCPNHLRLHSFLVGGGGGEVVSFFLSQRICTLTGMPVDGKLNITASFCLESVYPTKVHLRPTFVNV